MFCQACRAPNPDDVEYCRRCHSKLLVLSGGGAAREEAMSELEEEFSFDEHLLERISILEEALKRATETLEHLLVVVHKQQESLAMNEAAVAAARELLERKGLVEGADWEAVAERHRDLRLLALEKRERFLHQRDKILGLYRGRRRSDLERLLEAAEQALAGLQLDEALELLEAAFRLDRDNHELAHFVGETLFHAGRGEQAREYFESVLEHKPSHFEALVYSGVLAHEEGEEARALERLEQAVRLYPQAFLPHFSLGAVFANQGELGRAAEHLTRAVAVDAAPQALFLLGRCLHELGRTSEAIRCLEETVKKSPSFEEAHHQLGLAYLDRRWTRKALASFRQAQRLNPRKLRYQELVRGLSADGGGALPEVPAAARRHLVRGEAALDRGAPEKAYASFRAALAAAPEHPTVLTWFALACVVADRFAEVEPLVRKVAAAVDDELLLAAAYAAWIEALRHQGRLREGNRIGRLLLERRAGSLAETVAYYELACNLAEMEEDLDEALDYARRSLELSPEELQQFPLTALGWVHYKRREFPQAVDYLMRASRLGATSTTLTRLGMALRASGDEDEARRVLAQAEGLPEGARGVELKMMECLRDTDRLAARLRGRARPRQLRSGPLGG